MANRRAFLASLGLGIGGLGLPNVAQAFGRRRRRDCAQPCPPPSCPQEIILPPTPHKVCPISRAQYNGVYYYGALDCYYNPPRNTSFTSGNFIDPLATDCTSGIPPCINFNMFMLTALRRLDDDLPHLIHDSPSLKRPLDPKNEKLISDVGKASEAYPYDINLVLSDGTKRRVHLMILIMAAPKEIGGGIALLPVGQEAVGDGKVDDLQAETENGPVCTVWYGGHRFFIILVKGDGTK
jgi:hypothetical protein